VRFTAEEKQILAMYYKGSVNDTLIRLNIIYDDVCEYDNDPLLEDVLYSTMAKLTDMNDRELRRAVRDTGRPAGIWP